MVISLIEYTDFFHSSREMAKRNKIFNNIASHLENEFEMEKDEALILAKKALVENRHDGINQVLDICNRPAQDCNSSSKFRTITGTCNNLNQPYWGAANTLFTREIKVGVYNPKTDFAIYDKNNLLSGKYSMNKKHIRLIYHFILNRM